MVLNIKERLMQNLTNILLHNTKFTTNGRPLDAKIEEDADITITWSPGSLVLGGGETTVRLDTLAGPKGDVWTSDVYATSPDQKANKVEFKMKMSFILYAFKDAYLKSMPLKRKIEDEGNVWYKYSVGRFEQEVGKRPSPGYGPFFLELVEVPGGLKWSIYDGAESLDTPEGPLIPDEAKTISVKPLDHMLASDKDFPHASAAKKDLVEASGGSYSDVDKGILPRPNEVSE